MMSNALISKEKFDRNTTIYRIEIVCGAIFALYIIGIPFLVYGLRRRKLAKKCERYASVLAADPEHRISSIAASTGESYGEVVQTLGEINKRGLFTSCCVNEAADTVRFAGDTALSPSGFAAAQSGAPYMPVTCPNCNGVTKLPAGAVSECEYCGSPIEAPAKKPSAHSANGSVRELDMASEKKKQSIADVTLGEVAAAGAAVVGAISVFKD